ncbi:novel solute carrier family 18 (vesicular monoamine) slca18 protein [Xenopus tropicalis]|uniref:Novel solute carrier family 18 (Vesicular monoamine) slca18 protein n=1 Tax=Xenopus tropicalis TaxID=8364 RepID=Q28IV1_XENTR|nr:novel solute carrier family 18 (vesicular monoamine) slca18 protein [Xenopus tropicalis]CAJ83300.1 novel solute carrier family 18 (vesicular monoamine) slca18 protein [Xenopus tropicalis]|eukprot:NP_001037956.1 novel solute carrier family 18 (vesicular monoamine) slca18 protein [Xenopus tropicalis]
MAGCSAYRRDSRWLILFVVAVAMVMDYILFTIVAPIAPALLYDTEYGNRNTTVLLNNSSGSSLYRDSIINNTESAGNQTQCYEEKDYLNEENVLVGLLLAIKALLQLLTNPIVGKIINRTGYDAPLFCGTIIMFLSTLMFAFADSYAFLCVARGLQGIGSSFTAVPALGMLAHVFPDDAERGKAMGIALSGVAIGVLAGPPFGSAMYEFVGKSAPFLAIAALALLDGVLQLCILRPTRFSTVDVPATPYKNLLMDPYILVAAVGLCICNLTFGMLETTLPIRMMETMCAPRYQLGLCFLPCIVAYFICLNVFAELAQKIGSAALGIGFGMMETSVMPLMAHLVDLRHTSNYGGIYAISDIALCIGYALGPSCGGAIAKAVGFKWLMIILGIINLVFAPLFILLRNPPGKEETKPLLSLKEKPDSC